MTSLGDFFWGIAWWSHNFASTNSSISPRFLSRCISSSNFYGILLFSKCVFRLPKLPLQHVELIPGDWSADEYSLINSCMVTFCFVKNRTCKQKDMAKTQKLCKNILNSIFVKFDLWIRFLTWMAAKLFWIASISSIRNSNTHEYI